ncbi:hypothetical protein BC835DRAFT_697864 [Cytidiella melzeri]|nr:hypothetical protein BC835DRAFT_697864 [Cytidiella melzeri]
MALQTCISGGNTKAHCTATPTTSSVKGAARPTASSVTKHHGATKMKQSKTFESNSTTDGDNNPSSISLDSPAVSKSTNGASSGTGFKGATSTTSSDSSSGQKGKASDGSDSDGDDDDDDDDKSNSDPVSGTFPGGTFDSKHCQFIDDNSGQIQFTGTWMLEAKPPQTTTPLTSHTAMNAGSQASITFNGTDITVYGLVHASNATTHPAMAVYTLDANTTDSVSIELPLPISSTNINHQPFFESSELAPGNHTLTIDVTTSGIPYTVTDLTICNKATSSGLADTGTLAKTTKPANQKLSAGDIAGIVVGCVVVALLLVLAFVLFHRRQRRMRSAMTANSPVTRWLERGTGTLFTSSTSIMRNTPSDPSVLAESSFAKCSVIEKSELADMRGVKETPLFPSTPVTGSNGRWSRLRRYPSIRTLPSLPFTDRRSDYDDSEVRPKLPREPPSV